MKLTIDIPDDLHRAIKTLAAQRGITMRAFVLEAIEKVLANQPRTVSNFKAISSVQATERNLRADAPR